MYHIFISEAFKEILSRIWYAMFAWWAKALHAFIVPLNAPHNCCHFIPLRSLRPSYGIGGPFFLPFIIEIMLLLVIILVILRKTTLIEKALSLLMNFFEDYIRNREQIHEKKGTLQHKVLCHI